MLPPRASSSARASSRRLARAGTRGSPALHRNHLQSPPALPLALWLMRRIDRGQTRVIDIAHGVRNGLRLADPGGRNVGEDADIARRAHLVRRRHDAGVERVRSLLGGEIEIVIV